MPFSSATIRLRAAVTSVAHLRGSEMLVRLLLISVAVASGSAFCVSLKPQLAARRSLPHSAPTMVMVPLKDTKVCPHSIPMPRGFGCLPSHPDPMVHVESGSGFRFGSQIYVKVLVDTESSTYYSSVNTSGRGDSGATPAWATPFCAGVPN